MKEDLMTLTKLPLFINGTEGVLTLNANVL